MKAQPIRTVLGAAAVACLIIPAAAQDRGNPEIRMIEVVEGSDTEPNDMMKRIEERLKQSNVDMPPEMRRQMMQSMRRAMDESEWQANPRANAPEMEPESRPWMIGIMAEPVGDLLRTHIDLPEESGLVISRIVDGSPAAKAGLTVSDILISAGDRKLSDIRALKEAVQAAGKSDRPLKLSIIHEGKRRQVSIMPDGPRPKEGKPAGQPPKRLKPDRPVRPGAEMFERQNRRFEEIGDQLRRMNQLLEKQQRQIKMLETRLSEGSKGGPTPPDRPMPRR